LPVLLLLSSAKPLYVRSGPRLSGNQMERPEF
jgi:hypothetical protein